MALAPCGVITNQQGKELVEHGSIQFPVACYANDLTKDFVPWHWHDEWEALIVKEGTAMISTGSEKHILLSTNDTVGNIGAVCGFFDAGYFTKVFREVKGTTPKEFRAGHSIR